MNKQAIFDWQAHLALLAVALIYGANYSIAKLVLDPGHLGPAGFIVLRIAGAALLFWMLQFFRKPEKIAKSDLRLLVLCAIFGVATNMLLFFMGLKRTTPIHASLIMTITPILVLLMSSIVLKERITGRKILGIGLGASGAILLLSYGQQISFASTQLVGDLMVLTNATSYALYLVLVKRLLISYQTVTVLKWMLVLGLLMVLPFGSSDLLEAEWFSFDLTIYLCIIYVIVCTTFLAYLFNAFALSRVRASTVSSYIYLQPVIAAGIALSLGQDTLSGVKLLAGGLIFLGVYLVSLK